MRRWRTVITRFYFDIDDGRCHFADDEGIDLPDAEAGRAQVLQALGEIARDALPRGDRQALTASIRNASGDVVYSAKVTVSGTWHEPNAA